LEHHHLHPESIKKIEKLVGIMKDNPSLLDARSYLKKKKKRKEGV